MIFYCTGAAARSSDVIEHIGDVLEVALPSYALGMAVSEDDWTGVLQLGYSFGATMITVHGIKSIFDVYRPDGSDNKSFPSGHTASAFSGATFIHKRYGIKQAAIPYALAAFTGYSRVHADKHFWDDVIVGAAISGLFTWIFVDRYEKLRIEASPIHAKLSYRTEF